MNNLRNKLQSLQPEGNKKTRSLLYAIGGGGFIHLLTLLVVAITNKDAAYFNPLYAVDIDRVLPNFAHSIGGYIFGWAFLCVTVYAIYRSLDSSAKDR